jgi:hypothetical protein
VPFAGSAPNSVPKSGFGEDYCCPDIRIHGRVPFVGCLERRFGILWHDGLLSLRTMGSHR